MDNSYTQPIQIMVASLPPFTSPLHLKGRKVAKSFPCMTKLPHLNQVIWDANKQLKDQDLLNTSR